MAATLAVRNIVVADLDESMGFYRNVFGFEPTDAFEGEDPALDAMTQLKNVRLRAQLMRNKQGIVIELTQFYRPAGYGSKHAKSIANYGLTHLAFAVENTDEARASVIAAGGRALDQTRVSVDTPKVRMEIDTVSGIYQVAIRGVVVDTTTASITSPVALYIDGVYLSGLNSLGEGLADVERVEVLKGPQATLYGRNSTGGAINIVTRDPDSTTHLDLSASTGNHGQQQYSGYVSGGTDVVAGSLTVAFNERDPYITNLSNGPEVGRQNTWAVRGKVKINFSPDWSLTLAGDEQLREDSSGVLQDIYDRPLGATVGGLFTNNVNQTYSDDPTLGRVHNAVYGGSVRVQGDLGFAQFVSISADRQNHHAQSQDNDGTSAPLIVVNSRDYADQFSQEFQLISQGNGPLQWIAGVVYLDGVVGYDPITVYVDEPPPLLTEQITGRATDSSVAGYVQASYAISDPFKITAGVRYTSEKATLNSAEIFVDGAHIFSANETDKRWKNFAPQAKFEYRPEEGQLLYASYTKGFRAGAYNLASPTTPGPLNPETVASVEIGGKHSRREFAEGR